MQKKLFMKIVIIALLTLALMIPLLMTGNLVYERQQRQAEVVADIAASYAGAQQITGPVLALPWTRVLTKQIPATAATPAINKEERSTGVHYLFPGELNVNGELGSDVKSRGLFHARVYQWNGRLGGHFELPSDSPLGALREGETVTWGTPYLAMGLDDPRGIIGQPTLKWGGRNVAFERGSRLKTRERGIHAPLPAWAPGQGGKVDFSIELGVRGTERIAFVPVGDANHFELRSDWPHPSFGGRYLPDPESQHIGEDGFRAVWTVSALAAEAAQQLRDAEAHCGSGCALMLDTLEIRLIEPIAIYSLSDRALKYSHLFIVLTFAAFFIFEALKRLTIHPIQYLLVGLALALFFLMLISLSEHLDFALAYALSAAACCALIAVYLAAVLASRMRGMAFGAALGTLFGALYFLLRSEDNALMLGSLLLFGLLAAAMLTTRRVDWYALGMNAVGGEEHALD